MTHSRKHNAHTNTKHAQANALKVFHEISREPSTCACDVVLCVIHRIMLKHICAARTRTHARARTYAHTRTSARSTQMPSPPTLTGASRLAKSEQAILCMAAQG